MSSGHNDSQYEHKVHRKLGTMFLLLSLNALIYYVPYRNNVLIGNLLGISLWFYFGALNGILILLVYLFVKGDIIINFEDQKIVFIEFKKTKEWPFSKLLGVYLLAQEDRYILRIRPKRLLTIDIKLGFEKAYEIMNKFEKAGIIFETVRSNKMKRLSHPFPILLSKHDQKPSAFNPEIPNWDRGITIRTKWISITMAPLLYIIGATLIIRIPYLLDGLTTTKGIVSFIYGATAFLLFDGGLYLLFGISLVVILAKRITKMVAHQSSGE